MTVIGIRELSRKTGEIVERVRRTRRPVIVTKRGRPAVALVELDRDALEDLILATVPEFTEGLRRADDELRRGKTRALSTVLAEIRSERARRRTAKPRRR
ncbi:MAG: type II toxin-antitoxin system Phd/YefM family antitoxin [Chloroflexota bacterium]